MNLIILLLLVTSVFCYDDDDPRLETREFKDLECPSKQLNTGSCDPQKDEKCDEDSFCIVNDVFSTSPSTIYMCCPKNGTYCDETGMHSFRIHAYNEKRPIIEFVPADPNPRTYLKNVTLNGINKTFSCPYPFSWQLEGTDRKAEPSAGFEVGQKLKTCTKNSDCKRDEFCGQAFNPSYCGTKGYPFLNNNCIDESNNGKPMQFCYQSPIIDEHITLPPDSVGFLLCDNHKSCESIPNTVCLPMDVEKYRYIRPDGTVEDDRKVRHYMRGICVTVTICSSYRNKSVASHPTGSGTCEGGDAMFDAFNTKLCCTPGYQLRGMRFEELECPSKQLNTGRCDPQNNITCDGDSLCMLTRQPTPILMCCPKNGTHCDHTGMHGFRSTYSNGMSSFPGAIEFSNYGTEAEWYYGQSVIWNNVENTLSCPVELSWQLFGTGMDPYFSTGLRVDERPKCKKNSDCKRDEICGQAMNPSYCGQRTDAHPYLKNNCMDKSDNGKPVQFCYKYPEFDDGITIPSDTVGLLLCDSHKSCESIPNTVCLPMDVEKYRYIKPDGTVENIPFNNEDEPPVDRIVPHDMTGICVIAKVCNPFKYEPFAKPGTDSEPCEGGDAFESHEMKLCCKYLPIRS